MQDTLICIRFYCENRGINFGWILSFFIVGVKINEVQKA
jgi:hypothetical protein